MAKIITMPELPEVETIRRDLAQLIVGKKITRVQVRAPQLVKPSVAVFRRSVLQAWIKNIERRAKMLLIELSTGSTIVIHLKMTGQLVWQSRVGKLTVGGHPITGVAGVPNKYTYISVTLSDSSALYFNDTRKFGYWKLVPTKDLSFTFAKIGPEPLLPAFTASVFYNQLQRRGRTTIKAAILDQSVVAGVGNIYADESLFVAHLQPSRRVNSLSRMEIKRLYTAIRLVLTKSIRARGTSFNSYRDGLGREGTYWEQRLVYGRKGESCSRCGTPIKKTTVAGRGTHYCVKCQK